VVDSSGVKVYGEGEWRVRCYGVERRRTWRKLHLAIDPQTQEIVAQLLTTNQVGDANQVVALLDQVTRPVESSMPTVATISTMCLQRSLLARSSRLSPFARTPAFNNTATPLRRACRVMNAYGKFVAMAVAAGNAAPATIAAVWWRRLSPA
jgi:hypothetical protein